VTLLERFHRFHFRYVIAVRHKRHDRWTILGYASDLSGLLNERDALKVFDEAKRTCYKARMRRVR
jgi:hypothetical protein